jgi:hypothetical protein
MFKMTKGDLAAKSDSQLSAIFREANKNLIAAGSEIATLQSLLAKIRAEIRKRG